MFIFKNKFQSIRVHFARFSHKLFNEYFITY